MREFDLGALQLCELDLLKEFVRVCDKHHLKYYLAWGTLLGAVRHQGFIPWDDDIDVCMPYEDYVRFKEVCETELGSEYFYEDWYNHHDCFLHWAKLRKNGTTCMTRREADLKIHWGVGLDIFPLIKIDTMGMSRTRKLANAVLKLILQRSYLPYGEKSFSKKVKGMIYAVIPKAMDEKIVRQCYKILSKSKGNAKYVYDFSDTWARAAWPAEVFGEGVKYQFEDVMLNCPNDVDAYLKQAYGEDYMDIPKVEDRIDHGDIIVDLEKDYTYYQSLKG